MKLNKEKMNWILNWLTAGFHYLNVEEYNDLRKIFLHLEYNEDNIITNKSLLKFYLEYNSFIKTYYSYRASNIYDAFITYEILYNDGLNKIFNEFRKIQLLDESTLNLYFNKITSSRGDYMNYEVYYYLISLFQYGEAKIVVNICEELFL